MTTEPTSDHTSTIIDDGDGWYDVECTCGFKFPGAPGAETAADIWGDHKVEVHTAGLRARLEAAEVVIETVRQWGEYTPRRVTAAMGAYETAIAGWDRRDP